MFCCNPLSARRNPGWFNALHRAERSGPTTTIWAWPRKQASSGPKYPPAWRTVPATRAWKSRPHHPVSRLGATPGWNCAGGAPSKAENTAALLDSGQLRYSMALCGDFLAQSLLAERERLAEADAKRLAARAEGDEHVFRNALAVLSSPLSKGADLPAADSGAIADHPIFAACRIVGRHLGIAMRNHPDLRPGTSISNPIEGIAKASAVRTRKVLLRGKWWRNDHGPLVAFWEHTGEPAALLRKKGQGYIALDPVTGKSQPVTATLAASFAAFAHTFYTPLAAPAAQWMGSGPASRSTSAGGNC